MDIRKIMGERIKEGRESLKMSQDEFAKAIGKTQKAVWEYEKGERGIRVEDVPLLAEVLGISITELFGQISPVPKEDEIQARYKRLFPCFQLFLEDTARQYFDIQTELLSEWFRTAEPLISHKMPAIQKHEKRAITECNILVGPANASPVLASASPLVEAIETSIRLHIKTEFELLEEKGAVNFSQPPSPEEDAAE